MSKIETRNLSFSYDDKPVIDDITFSVDKGETWAVIGRNGAGKSTLIKCLCGLLRHYRGEVLVNAAPITGLSPKEIARKIAYVPQSANRPSPPFTVREYVTMARFPYQNIGAVSAQKDRDCVDEALVLTDTARLSGRMMNTLSGGEFQAALIAGAVAQDTPFLLLDEPVAHLDPCHQENVGKMMRRVHDQRGTAVVTITHDVNFALSTHNNVLALIDGKVIFNGTRDDFCVDAADNLKRIFSVDFCALVRPDKKVFYFTAGEP